MKEPYANYAQLAKYEQAGTDYSIQLCFQSAQVGVFAIHGGGIEMGTSELALAIAGKEWSYYLFNGNKKQGNQRLHLTSTRFDEPMACQLAGQCNRIITLHGAVGSDERVYVGGLDEQWGQFVRKSLTKRGFQVSDSPFHLSGKERQNIVNRGRYKKGVQLELTTALRRALFPGLGRAARKQPGPRFDLFVEAVRASIADVVRAD